MCSGKSKIEIEPGFNLLLSKSSPKLLGKDGESWKVKKLEWGRRELLKIENKIQMRDFLIID